MNNIVVFTPGKHHVSQWYVLFNAGGLLMSLAILPVVLLGSIGVSLRSVVHATGSLMVVPMLLLGGILVLFALAVLSIGGVWLTWKNLTYELTTQEFNLCSGVISKKRIHVPYQRIQSVNQSAGVLKRVLGLCDLELDTAGGSSNTAIRIPYVTLRDAEVLRSEIFRRKNIILAGGYIDEAGYVYMPEISPNTTYTQNMNVLDAPNGLWDEIRATRGDATMATGNVSYERGLSNKELILAGASGSAGIAGAVTTMLLMILSVAAQFIGLFGEEWIAKNLSSSTQALQSLSFWDFNISGIFSNLLFQFALGFGLMVLIVWGTSIIGTIVSYGGFRVRRREDRIEVEHGLLQHVFQGVDIDRVQSVVVKQSLIRRLMGYCSVTLGKIDSVSSGEESLTSFQGVVIHPFIKTSQVPELLAGVLPEYDEWPQLEVRLPKVSRRRAIIRKAIIWSPSFWIFVVLFMVHTSFFMHIWDPWTFYAAAPFVAVCIAYIPLYYMFFAVIFIKNVIKAILWYRQSGLGYTDSYMRVVNGGYSLEDRTFLRKKIQYGYLKTNPFQRHAGVAIVCARTAEGLGTTETLWDVDIHDAQAWLTWIQPRG